GEPQSKLACGTGVLRYRACFLRCLAFETRYRDFTSATVQSGTVHPMIRSTTVIGVRRDGKTAIAADGQVTLGESTILKHTAKKVRRLAGGKVVCGFAGSVADAQEIGRAHV